MYLTQFYVRSQQFTYLCDALQDLSDISDPPVHLIFPCCEPRLSISPPSLLPTMIYIAYTRAAPQIHL